MEVSLAAEKLFSLFGIEISNSLLTSWLVIIFLLLTGFFIGRKLTRVPGRIQTTIEFVYETLLTMCETVIGRKDIARSIFPFVMTLFFFILFSNYTGLLPGFGSIKFHEVPLLRAPTSDLSTVLALSLITVFYIQYLGIRHLGGREYGGKFFNLRSPIDTMVGFQELISEISRIVSFSFRLFGNVFAGEVMIAVVTYLTMTYLPYVAILPLPFYLLELFVGFIQAFVFCFLTIIFTALAVTGHQHPESVKH